MTLHAIPWCFQTSVTRVNPYALGTIQRNYEEIFERMLWIRNKNPMQMRGTSLLTKSGHIGGLPMVYTAQKAVT